MALEASKHHRCCMLIMLGYCGQTDTYIRTMGSVLMLSRSRNLSPTLAALGTQIQSDRTGCPGSIEEAPENSVTGPGEDKVWLQGGFPTLTCSIRSTHTHVSSCPSHVIAMFLLCLWSLASHLDSGEWEGVRRSTPSCTPLIMMSLSQSAASRWPR